MDLSERNATNPHRHPWELSRSRCLLNMIRQNPRHFKYADIGAGDSYLGHQLLTLTEEPLHAVDVNAEPGNKEARIILHKDVKELAPESMDVILLLDVLEHVEDDAALLQQSLRALQKGGQCLITVPAHPALFSEHDKALHHYRRYTRKALLQLAKQEKLIVKEVFYFYGSLLVIRCAEMIREKLFASKKKAQGIGHWPFSERHFLTRGLEAALTFDFTICRAFSRMGLPMPGLSLCLSAQKPSA